VRSAADIFDTNRYANSTRSQFLNWSFIKNTAWELRGGQDSASRRRARVGASS
jgi:hypothetical protein